MPRLSSHFGMSSLPLLLLLAAAAVFGLPGSTSAALLDVWRADDLNLDDSDIVLTWNSASNRTANALAGQQPVFRLNATPGGSAAVRFNGTHRMTVAASGNPAAGRSAFSVA